MRRIDLDGSSQFSVHPRTVDEAAWENERVDRPAGVNDCEPHIAVVRNIRRGPDLMPHGWIPEHVTPDFALI